VNDELVRQYVKEQCVKGATVENAVAQAETRFGLDIEMCQVCGDLHVAHDAGAPAPRRCSAPPVSSKAPARAPHPAPDKAEKGK
jgi:hypothetical protein